MKSFQIFLCILVTAILITLFVGGEFTSLQKGKRSVQCKQVKSLPGAEDMVLDASNQMLYLSVDDRRAVLRGEQKTGHISVIDVQQSEIQQSSIQARVLSLVDQNFKPLNIRFHPHGIDLLVEHGEIWIWVINHHFGLMSTQKSEVTKDYPYEHTIDIFKVDDPKNPQRLILQKRLSSTLLNSPNDLVVLSSKEAYVTNDHASTSKLGKAFETLAKRSWANVIHYHQDQWRHAYQGIAFANGIEISKDHKKLIVASANGDGIQVFDRNKNGDLKHAQSIAMNMAVDNLSWNQDHSTLWITSHPKPLRFLLHARSAKIASPTYTQSLFFNQNTQTFEDPQLQLGQGLPISGGSITVETNHSLWIGSVFENFILHCQ